MPESSRYPVFARCTRCGECWKVFTAPIHMRLMSSLLLKAYCPNCLADVDDKRIFLCPTEGEGAVTAAKNGRDLGCHPSKEQS